MKLLAIDGSYRKGGITDQTVTALIEEAKRADITIMAPIYLRDRSINFCLNCRQCTQKKGEKRGECPQKDDMEEILKQIDAADVIVLAAPVNFYNVNAITRRFMERLTPYAYWPWGKGAPSSRKKGKKKKAILVTSSAMPAFLGRFFTGAIRALKGIAGVVGAKTVGTIFIGLVGSAEKESIGNRIAPQIRKIIGKL